MTDTPYLIQKDDTLLLRVYVSPRARMSKVVGVYDEKLKISLAAPPADGKANKELLRFVAEILQCSKSSVQLLKGSSSKDKVLEISNITFDEAKKAIEEALSK